MTDRKQSIPKIKNVKMKDPKLVLLSQPEQKEDGNRAFLDAAIELKDYLEYCEEEADGYLLLTWSKKDGTFNDRVAFNTGGIHPALFVEFVSRILGRYT